MGDLASLRRRIEDLGSVIVAFSGGVDSALLAYVAHETLGDGATAVTAVSPSLADSELRACEALASGWGMRWLEVRTDELDRPRYRKNDPDRCYWCKDALMDAVGPLAATRDAVVALGVNLDDLGEHRPGQTAAAERGAVFPLVDAGFTKSDVRDASRSLGLSTAEKPAAACLASRIPYGTEVTVDLLTKVERAEEMLRSMGFASLRVRHYGDTARIEVPVRDLPGMIEHREAVVGCLRSVGYRYVTLDLEGLRSGNLNGAIS